mgnify:CR=1 FL=1|tara:strand:- start:1728 stop:1943 length:216 start_codon:yes stop_codon:yes gene_type:complete
MNTTTDKEITFYVTPWTLLTVFSILWAFSSCMRAMYMPVKVLYGVVNGIQKIVTGILYLGGKKINNGARNT